MRVPGLQNMQEGRVLLMCWDFSASVAKRNVFPSNMPETETDRE